MPLHGPLSITSKKDAIPQEKRRAIDGQDGTGQLGHAPGCGKIGRASHYHSVLVTTTQDCYAVCPNACAHRYVLMEDRDASKGAEDWLAYACAD